MRQKSNILPKRNKMDRPIKGLIHEAVFWDVDMKNIFVQSDKEFIIRRVLSRPQYEGVLLQLEALYPLDQIKKGVENNVELHSMDDMRILSQRYQVPLKSFINYFAF